MDYIAAVASVPAIVALVNILKGLGLPHKLSPLIAVLIGVALNLAVWAWSAQSWFEFAATGLLLGLAASGIYDLSKLFPGAAAITSIQTGTVEAVVQTDMVEVNAEGDMR